MKICYPFIYEDGLLCDYEIETDRLCSQVGLAIELLATQGHTVQSKGVFVLPAGVSAACALHIARCQAKTVVRLLHRLKSSGQNIPAQLFDWTNLLANHLFLLCEQINQESQRAEIPFISRSY